MGKDAINCPSSNGNASVAIPDETVISPPILFVTIINWSIHKMLLAYIGAIPIPINDVKIPIAMTLLSANKAKRVLPTRLIKNPNKRIPKGLNLKEMNIATSLIIINEPQNTAVILAPTFLDN